jgi:hypothetical protein
MSDPLTRDQALTLFKLYEDKGWAVKQQMLAIFGLLTPVVFGLLAFCVRDYLSTISTTTIAAGWTTFVLSVFLAVLIVLSLLHANRDYTRSHQVLELARDKALFPEEILKVMRGDDREHHPSDCHEAFGHIGWQFRAIMGMGFALVMVSFLVAFAVTLAS